MEKLYSNKTAFLTLFIALGLIGSLIITNNDSLISFLSIQQATHNANHFEEGSEHSANIIVSGDDREVFPREKPISFQIKNYFSTPASVNYSFLLTDELGNEIDVEPTSIINTIEPNGSKEYSLPVPLDIEEGLYSFQITAVSHANGQFADSGINLNFAILNNNIYMLTDEAWLKYSLSNVAVFNSNGSINQTGEKK